VIFFIVRSQQQPAFSTTQTKEYQVSYPKDWIFKEDYLAGNVGSNNTLTPASDSSTEKPNITVQGTNTAATSMSRFQDNYQQFGYSSNSITVDGLPATKFFGTIPERLTNPGPRQQELAVVVQKGSMIYFIRMTYYGDQSSQLEQVFTNFYSSLHFN
jgi:hypothetical protein